MIQQINLFSPSLRPAPRLLTALRVAGMLGALMLALLGYQRFLAHQVFQVEAAVAQANLRLKEVQDQAVQLGKTATGARGQALEKSIAEAESELKLRQSLLDRLKGGGFGNTKGFSDYMVALARQHSDGVWITGLSVEGGAGDFTIQGGVSRPEILPAYLHRLNREEVLRGRQIGDLRLQRKEIEIRGQDTPGGAPAAASPGSAAVRAAPPQRLHFVEFSIGSGAAQSRPGG